MSDECVFCQIAAGEIPAQVLLEDEEAIVFHDLNPQAPTHLLVIPRRHVESTGTLETEDGALAGHLLLTAARAARQAGIHDSGYRVVANTGNEGGQTVPHLHLHVLGGRPMSWPPG